ncbi:MAG TPA: type II secretion system F family protein [Kofleriaceae bacterium]|jgi:type IV pilus assembly protein PilC|nr:type II secretion system F family protein [Kofleriaceae bacterium]
MAKYKWEATARNGETRKGSMEALDEAMVASRLRAEGMTPKNIRKPAGQISIVIGSGVPPKDLQIFTRQLATMIDAGLPLVQCLDVLANQTPNQHFAKILFQVKQSVEQGATFSDSLRKHPKVFDELFVNLVAAGEVGGILDTILNRLAVYIEKNVKLKGQLKSAMVYPISILVIAIGVIAVMLTKVIPVFEHMYQQFSGAQLPAPTKFVIKISDGFIKDGPFIVLGIIAFAVLFGMAMRTEKGKDIFDATLLKVPVIGSVLRKIVVARFTRTLGTLLSSGVPILDALEICAKTSGNRVVKRGIMYARSKIAEGQDMAGPLGESKVFPGMVVQMIGVGEQTGAMDQMLQKIADFYEDEVDTAVAAMTSLIEPIMMAFLGVVVGGLIVAMYLPIFKLAGNIAGKH